MTSNMRVTPLVFGVVEWGFYKTNYSYKYRTDAYNDQNNYKSKLDLFRIDYRFSYQRVLSRKFTLGVEFGYGKTTARMWDNTNGYYNSQGQFIEPLEYTSDPIFRAYSFLLTFEFNKSSSLQGGGLSWSGGIGPKFYSFIYDENYRFSKDSVMSSPYSLTESNLFAINFFYQLSYRLPLTKSLFFETGIRFHSGILIPVDGVFDPTYTNYWSKSDMYARLIGDNFFNLMSLKTGLVIEL